MNETVFKTQNLTKKYRDTRALDHVNMEITAGSIYGFVGENGAGKTTMIRIIAGFATQTEGTLSLFGSETPAQLTRQRRQLGAIVETPAFHPDLSAAQNLEIARLQQGLPDKKRIGETLDIVGLADAGKKKLRHFSLGMKQRLGLGMALLSEPAFLVLDEPVNGLDPVGIVELRELLKRLNRERGTTILISSHILGELYQLATCYGFIHKGQMLEQLTLEQLDKKCRQYLSIRVDDVNRATTILETKLNTYDYEILPDKQIRLYDHLGQSNLVAATLIDHGLSLSELSTNSGTLENYYLKLIGGN
ncbi:MAG: ATP-binding cassette domain-containing protein [Lachnospiraceae bacterium]|nr:ATP-binding cassette domain-containing protein [Lachnospiraceae bacterium]